MLRLRGELMLDAGCFAEGNSNIDARNSGSLESADDFEKRSSVAIPRIISALSISNRVRWEFNGENVPEGFDGLDDSFTTLTDGLEEKVKKSATDFEVDHNKIEQDDYNFSADVNFPTKVEQDDHNEIEHMQ